MFCTQQEPITHTDEQMGSFQRINNSHLISIRYCFFQLKYLINGGQLLLKFYYVVISCHQVFPLLYNNLISNGVMCFQGKIFPVILIIFCLKTQFLKRQTNIFIQNFESIYLGSRGRETEKKQVLLCAALLPKCPQWPELGHSETGSLILVSHQGDRSEHSCWSHPHCLQGSVLEGGWNQEAKPGLQPRHQAWDAGVLTGALTTGTNSHPSLFVFDSKLSSVGLALSPLRK